MIGTLSRAAAIPLLTAAYRRTTGMILLYHEVFAPGDRTPHTSTQITADDFRAQLEFVRATCRVLDLPTFVERLAEGRLPGRACAITFDDGFADNVEVALPILQELGLPATFFIADGYVTEGRPYEADAVHDILRLAPPADRVELDLEPWGGERMALDYRDQVDRTASYFRVTRAFKDQISYRHRTELIEHLAERFSVPLDQIALAPMMTPEQVRTLADAGMTIGSHTRWHVSLSADGPDEFARQLVESRLALEKITGHPVRYVSYPFGDARYCIPACELVAPAGYDAAFMACGLSARRDGTPWLIDRLATSGGLIGLWASMAGVKPSQFRQRREVRERILEFERQSGAF